MKIVLIIINVVLTLILLSQTVDDVKRASQIYDGGYKFGYSEGLKVCR